jgi:hypothetical protein
MVMVVKEAKRQDSQLAGQGELVCCVAHTEVVADTVVGHRFCSAIFDGSCWCLLDLPFLLDGLRRFRNVFVAWRKRNDC